LLRYPDGTQATWNTNNNRVTKIRIDQGKWEELAALPIDGMTLLRDSDVNAHLAAFDMARSEAELRDYLARTLPFYAETQAREAGIDCSDATLAGLDLSGLTHEAEIELAKKIAEWPRLVEIAAKGNEPHRVAFYLYELASDLHGLWNRGNDDLSLRFYQEGNAATSATKIALARATGVVIGCGLGILGVTPVEEMR
ncbi:MAG: hypothetical protein RL472_1976, partial [Pseudomonadota bacterium]